MNYELEITNYIDGGLAQLVERLLCKQDVSGSSPLISTLCKNRKKIISLIVKQDKKQI